MFALSPTAYVIPTGTTLFVQKTYSTQSGCSAADSTAVAYALYARLPTCSDISTPATAPSDSNAYPNTQSSSYGCSAPSVPIASVSSSSPGFGLMQFYSTATCSGTPQRFSFVPLNVCQIDDYSSTVASSVRTYTYTYAVYTAVTASGVSTFTKTAYTTKDCTGTPTSTVVGASTASGCASASTASKA